MRITQVIRSLQDRVVELLVQLEVCVRVGMRVICVLRYQRCRGGRLRARAPKGMHWRRTLRTWKNILKTKCMLYIEIKRTAETTTWLHYVRYQ